MKNILIFLLICPLINELAIGCQIYFRYGYCSRVLCPERGHVACKPEGRQHIRCRHSLEKPRMGTAIREEILQTHNEHRARVARYGLPLLAIGNYTPRTGTAAKMNIVSWSYELAYLAELNIQKCVARFERCIATHDYRHPGQLISQRSVEMRTFRKLDAVRAVLQDWGEQELDMEIFNTFPDIQNGSWFSYIYTSQYLHDKVKEIGCAIGLYTDIDDLHIFSMCCVYSQIILYGDRVFVTGDTASKCKARDSTYPELCSHTCSGITVNLYFFVIILILLRLF